MADQQEIGGELEVGWWGSVPGVNDCMVSQP